MLAHDLKYTAHNKLHGKMSYGFFSAVYPSATSFDGFESFRNVTSSGKLRFPQQAFRS